MEDGVVAADHSKEEHGEESVYRGLGVKVSAAAAAVFVPAAAATAAAAADAEAAVTARRWAQSRTERRWRTIVSPDVAAQPSANLNEPSKGVALR